MIEEYELFRDQLRTIAVQDPDRLLVAAAGRCLEDMSPAWQYLVVRLASNSFYGPRLRSLYAAIVVMEAA